MEQAVFAIASCVRHRRWHLPDPLTDAEERTYINVRPLLQGLSSPSSWHLGSPLVFLLHLFFFWGSLFKTK